MSKMIRCRRDYDHLCICANRGAILFTLQMENHGKGKTVMSSSNLWKKWASGSLFAQSTLPVCSQQEKGKGPDEQDLGYKKPKAKKWDTTGLFFLPQVLRLHHSKREDQGGHTSPRELLEAAKEEFPFFQMGKWDHPTETKGFSDFSFFSKKKCDLLSLHH